MLDTAAEAVVSVRLVAIADLTPNPRNARTHPPEQIEQIAASMREFGFTNPILADVDDDGIIVAGHGRRLAALKLIEAGEPIRLPSGRFLPKGMVPVIDCTGWSESQRRAYTLADNRLAETSEWDDELLKIELGFLQEEGFDLDLTGFDERTISKLLDFAGTDGEGDPDEVPEAPETPVSKAGDVWLLGNHRIICGDSTNAETVAALLGDEKPNLMVTDPPYGVKYDPAWREELGIDWQASGKKSAQRLSTHPNAKPLKSRSLGKVENDDRADWRETWALFPGRIAYVWHGGLRAAVVQESLVATDFAIRAQIIWVKQHFVFSRGDYHWQHEPCWYAVRGTGNWTGDRKQTTVWEIANASAFHGEKGDEITGHGTQKPVECMKRPIENNSEPGDAVYEPFSGSGSTIIAGEMTGRRVFAIELNPAYVDVAVRRWQSFTGREATLLADGRSFASVAEERVR